jgi:outer membrane lipoprotein-sorting protein
MIKRCCSLVLISLFLLGCAEEINVIESVEDKHSKLKDYSGTIVITSNLTDMFYKANFWVKKDKQKIVYTHPEEREGRSVICNGSMVWFYNPQDDSAVYAEVGSVQIPSFDYGDILKEILNESTTNVSETALDGKAVYLIRVKPKEDIQIDIWIEKEGLYPLRIQWIKWITIAESIEILRVEYQNMAFDTGLSDEFFEFFPSENTSIMSIEEWRGKKISFGSVEEAEKVVDFKILVPKHLPAQDFNQSVEVLKKGFETTVVLTYYNNSTTFEIHEKVSDEPIELENAEEIVIDNNTAYFTDSGFIKVLAWKRGNLEITITGVLDKKEMLKIAESIKN